MGEDQNTFCVTATHINYYIYILIVYEYVFDMYYTTDYRSMPTQLIGFWKFDSIRCVLVFGPNPLNIYCIVFMKAAAKLNFLNDMHINKNAILKDFLKL